MFAIFLINTLVVALAAMVHYEAPLRLSLWLPRLAIRLRYRVGVGLAGALVAHVIEAWIFGIAYFLLLRDGSFGALRGLPGGSLLDCVYFSIVTYTSLGYGDLVPVGLIRFTAGLEALTGLVLIAMTASFMYFQIEKYWKKPD